MKQELIIEQIHILNESLSILHDERNIAVTNIEKIKNEIAILKAERNEHISENLIGQSFQQIPLFVPVYFKILELYQDAKDESFAKGIMCQTYDASIGIFEIRLRYILDEDDYTNIPTETFDTILSNIKVKLSKYFPQLNEIVPA